MTMSEPNNEMDRLIVGKGIMVYPYVSPFAPSTWSRTFEQMAFKHGFLALEYLKNDGRYPLDYMQQVLERCGYTIQIMEVSTNGFADQSDKSKVKDWHRIPNMYRWELAVWDEYGSMITLKYSDTCGVSPKTFSTKTAALLSVIECIVKNKFDIYKHE